MAAHLLVRPPEPALFDSLHDRCSCSSGVGSHLRHRWEVHLGWAWVPGWRTLRTEKPKRPTAAVSSDLEPGRNCREDGRDLHHDHAARVLLVRVDELLERRRWLCEEGARRRSGRVWELSRQSHPGLLLRERGDRQVVDLPKLTLDPVLRVLQTRTEQPRMSDGSGCESVTSGYVQWRSFRRGRSEH